MKTRADCCDNAGDALRRTLPEASDAFAELKQAAPGWSFTGSVPQMQQRWEALNKYLRSQLTQGAESFRLSAGEYHGIDIKAALGIARTSGGN
ncbi:hypothetical protein SRB5_39310 [Streptomyces sp. RB5]|uniref:Uncharacterized protein n=1 Tax=Streptomyces smaragdinus TaxID=2585196 RepID=A0A7K0CJX4_9ACTN|nr:hypothetical protein [Streptomyces smaragdinus]MQY13777.1 hypothetical protein [Streptomyces smaragdinus]